VNALLIGWFLSRFGGEVVLRQRQHDRGDIFEGWGDVPAQRIEKPPNHLGRRVFKSRGQEDEGSPYTDYLRLLVNILSELHCAGGH
jgi:hypothetical protein